MPDVTICMGGMGGSCIKLKSCAASVHASDNTNIIGNISSINMFKLILTLNTLYFLEEILYFITLVNFIENGDSDRRPFWDRRFHCYRIVTSK